MAKIFPIIKKVIVNNIVVQGEGNEFENEELRYSLPEVSPLPEDTLQVGVSIPDELVGDLTEEVVAALLARAEEDLPLIEDINTIEISITPEIFEGALDTIQIPLQSNEFFFYDEIQEDYTLELSTSEISETPIEDTNIAISVNDIDIVIPEQEDNYQLETSIFEDNIIIDDTYRLQISTTEDVVYPEEFVSIELSVTSLEKVDTPNEIDSIVVSVPNEIVDDQSTENNIVIDLTGFGDNVVANIGWVNPNNSLENTTGTATTLSASSSGLLGGNSNTTNGDIIIDIEDINVGDATITSAVIFVETQRENGGLLTNPQSDVEFQYSFDGVNFTTFHRITNAQGKSIQTVDVTSIIANQTNLVIRAVGSVTSGPGLGAETTVSLFRCGIVLDANATYID